MPYCKIEPSGCVERHGLVQVRLAMYLDEGDHAYEKTYVQVPVIPEGGYKGAVDEIGSPIDQADYDNWIASLPKVYQLNPFHNHFLHLEPSVTDQEIEDLMAFHLANFYEAWKADYGEVKGGMRKGWDVKHRKRPIRYDVEDPKGYPKRRGLCIARLAQLKSNSALIRPDKGGELFPATVIDVGLAATDRASGAIIAHTLVSKDNPANDTGSIDTVEIWLSVNGENVEVATFIDEGSNVFSTRDYEAIGAVTSGSKQTFTGKNISVATGDYIGIYGTAGRIETDTDSIVGLWYVVYTDLIPCTSETFSFISNYKISLYGTGETLPTDYPINSAVSIGVAVGASLTRGITRSASVLIGELVSASRLIGVSRVSSVLVGVLASASRAITITRASSVLIGELVSATVSRGVSIASAILIGIKTTASKARGITRTSSVLIGELVTATKSWGKTFTSSVIIGVKVSALYYNHFLKHLLDSTLRNLKSFTSRDIKDFEGREL